MRDIESTFKYFHKNASKYGFNSDKMALGGVSSGCMYVLAAARSMTEKGEGHLVRFI